MKPLILDANLLVLLVVGLVDPKLISQHRRTQGFVEEDFPLLKQALQAYTTVLITPGILAESSNLLRYDAEPRKSHLMNVFRELLGTYDERHVAANEIAHDGAFVRLGLTDTGILDVLERERASLLTVDLELYLEAAKRTAEVYNFNHIRERHLPGG